MLDWTTGRPRPICDECGTWFSPGLQPETLASMDDSIKKAIPKIIKTVVETVYKPGGPSIAGSKADPESLFYGHFYNGDNVCCSISKAVASQQSILETDVA